jgi:DNA-binding CsgD family transcriptional regulator
LLQQVTADGPRAETFRENCVYYGLTKTEIQIAELLYEGLANKDIADKLFISQETVKKHIYNMFRKTEVKNRSGLLHTLQKSRF